MHPRTSGSHAAHPLVKIGTEDDDQPPLIIENPDSYPFELGERAEYREATDEEYRRYADHYSALDEED